MRTYKPHAQVAHRSSRRIDGVDGVPTTHKQHGWVHAWTVTDGPNHPTPHPFTAKKSVPAAVAVPAMCAVVLTAMASSLLVVLEGHPNRAWLVVLAFGVLGIWTLLLLVPAFVRTRR